MLALMTLAGWLPKCSPGEIRRLRVTERDSRLSGMAFPLINKDKQPMIRPKSWGVGANNLAV